MFDLMYHVPTTTDHGDEGLLRHAECEVHALLEVGRVYGCSDVVSLHIDNVLNIYRETILDECRNKPVSMLEVAVRYQCDWIFREAGLHLLGRSNKRWDLAQDRLKELGIQELFTAKREEFVSKLKAADHDLLSMSVRYERSTVTGEQAVAEMELPLAFFRSWLSPKICNAGKQGHRLHPGYAEVYHRLVRGREFLPGYNEIGEYLRKSHGLESGYGPSVAFVADLQMGVDAVFKVAADRVKHLTKVETAAKYPDETSVLSRGLTCMEISDDELPWGKE
ncbi:uncharacterized protein LTR77_001589 [Saxophila tyrrhenica]|uniref:Uncharacterized protein n=1 Tax=Saxophila tyrrhenica TaxID=1690608 RepID=A0AAV9PLX8_9PEZI|nr:hypothetical protein LTR77_001589 [Saxophila tyrrhenica]